MMRCKNLISIFTIIICLHIFCVLPVFTQRRGGVRQQVQFCNTPDNNIGVCVTLSNCQSIGRLFAQNNRSQQVIQYIKGLQRNCGTRSLNGDPVVCCQDAYRGEPRITTQPPPTRRVRTTTLAPIRISTPPPVVTTLAPSSIESESRSNKDCFTPELEEGTCKAILECPFLLEKLRRNKNDPDFVQHIRNSNEICNKVYSYVCCPNQDGVPTETSTHSPKQQNLFLNRLPTVEDGCGQTKNTFKKIVGGNTAQLGAWPWIALLGYEVFNEVEFKCGGSLISQRHILTAAHCIRDSLVLVRLGEHDLTTEKETKHIDIRIDRKERHPYYSRQDGFADIGILYLEKTVYFTDFIKPICLPRSVTLRTKSYVDYSPFVVGWGRTQEGGDSATVLQELQISIFNNSVCSERYRRQNRYKSQRQFGKTVLCAGFLGGGKDSCFGDSGGPLMIPEKVGQTFYFYEIGIVSYGIGCARADVPGVYTKVQEYIDWIEQKISETVV